MGFGRGCRKLRDFVLAVRFSGLKVEKGAVLALIMTYRMVAECPVRMDQRSAGSCRECGCRDAEDPTRRAGGEAEEATQEQGASKGCCQRPDSSGTLPHPFIFALARLTIGADMCRIVVNKR